MLPQKKKTHEELFDFVVFLCNKNYPGSLLRSCYHFVNCIIDEIFNEVVVFNFCIIVGIIGRIFIRNLFANDNPTTSPFSFPSEPVTPDCLKYPPSRRQKAILIVVIVKKADSFVFVNQLRLGDPALITIITSVSPVFAKLKKKRRACT